MGNNMEKDAEIDETGDYRYRLTRTWDKSKERILFVRLNFFLSQEGSIYTVKEHNNKITLKGEKYEESKNNRGNIFNYKHSNGY